MFTGLGTYVDYKAEEWLYGDWNEDKVTQFRFLYSNGFIRPYLDYKLDQRSDREYLKHTGLTYSDIHDPRKLSSVNSGARLYGTAWNFVSRNVSRLYR